MSISFPERSGVGPTVGNHRKRIETLERRQRGSVVMSPSSLMSDMFWLSPFIQATPSYKLGLMSGTLYLPERDGPQLLSGETIGLDFSDYHGSGTGWFDWLGFKAYTIQHALADWYKYGEPWESRPFSGVAAAGSGSSSPVSFSGTHTDFATLAGVCDSDSATISWGGLVTEAAIGSWPVAGVGTVAFAFHEFGTGATGTVNCNFSAGSKFAGSLTQNLNDGTAIAIGSEVIDVTSTHSLRIQGNLTADLDPGDGLILICAVQLAAGDDWVSNEERRPAVEVRYPNPGVLVPKFKIGTQLYPITPRRL